MAGAFPQVGLEHLGAHHHLVAPFEMLPALEILDEAPEHGALGVIDHHPGPGFLFNAEQPQLPAQTAVVPAFGLLQKFQVALQFLLGGKGGAVNPLEHGPAFVSPPVGPGGGGELEGLDEPGGGDVGTPAEIDEIPLLIEAHLLLGDLLQKFHLVGFVFAPEVVDGLLPAHVVPPEGLVLGRQLGHVGFNFRQIFGSKGLGHAKVIVKARFDGRADGHFDPGKQVPHRLGHQVGGGMAHDLQTLGAVQADGGDGAVARQRQGQVHQIPVDPGCHHLGIFGQTQGLKGLGHRRPLRQGGGGTLIQRNFDHACLNKKGISGPLESLPRCRQIRQYVTYG